MFSTFLRTCWVACIALIVGTDIGRSQITIPATVDGWNVIITVGVDGKIDVDPWYADAFSEDEEYTLPDWLIPDNLSANVPITDPLTSENREAIGFAIGMAVGEALIEWSAEAVGDWWDSLPPGSHNLILQGIVLALT